MKEKRIAREITMQLLFQWEMQGMLSRHNEIKPDFLGNFDLRGFLGHFLSNFYLKDKTAIDLNFTGELIKGTIANIVTIDQLLDQISSKWRLARMDAIDRAILRIACFELVIQRIVSKKVIINEAVEIAKRFGSVQSPAFINGILDSLKVG